MTKLQAREELGHWKMFSVRLSREDFGSKFEIVSFLMSFLHFEVFFFVSRAFVRFGVKRPSFGAFGFDDILGLIFRTPICHQAFFFETLSGTLVFMKNSLLTEYTY